MKVLIVDDDPLMLRLLEASLTKWGHDILIARDGLQARSLIADRDNCVSMVLLDREMPGMDGLELCRQVRQSDRGDYVYIILLTAHREKDDIVAGLDAGADDYVTKPFNPEELRVRLKAGLRIIRLERELVEANRRLHEQAVTDYLTGALNRRAMIGRLEEELSRSRRDGKSVAVCLADIDHFKRVNDCHGHAAGDAVLVQLVRMLSETSRRHDVVGRYGGEEFMLLLPAADVEAARRVAERCRKTVETRPIAAEGQQLRITVSIGLAAAPAQGEPVTPGHLIAAADRALYEAKAAGRNRVVAGDVSAAPVCPR